MKTKLLSLAFLASIITTLSAQPQNLPQMQATMPFVENNGQVIGTDSVLHPEILYYTDVNGLRAYFSKNRIAHVWQKHDSINFQDTLYRMDASFQGFNPGVAVQVAPADSMPGRLNYFLSYIPSNVTGVRMWNKIVYKNLYPNSDLIFSNNGVSLNYRFDMAPNANLSDIQIKFEGATNIQVTGNGKLVVTTPYGTIVYEKPKGFKSTGNNNNFTPVNVDFQENGNIVTLHVNVTVNGRLVVDIQKIFPTPPVLPVINQETFWSTYFGNTTCTEPHDSYVDVSNNLYLAGGAVTSTVFPFANSLLLPLSGTWDGVIAKFAPNRSLKYGAWIGGSVPFQTKVY
jgi:hypothetical protein